MGNAAASPTVTFFPIRMRKLDNIYVRQTIRWLFGDILSFNIKLGLYENLAKT